jgi:uncharacterized membrane protein
MNTNMTTARMSLYFGKVRSLGNPAVVFHALFSVLLVALAVQGIPFLAVHTANHIGSIQMGYWLTGSGAVLFFTTVLWILLSKN